MKNLKNIGKALTNAEQKTINGGYPARPLCRAKEVCHHFCICNAPLS
jgi:hypothetical protein